MDISDSDSSGRFLYAAKYCSMCLMNEIFSNNSAYHLFLCPFIFSDLFLGFRPLSIQPQFLSDTRLSYSFEDIVVVSCLVSLVSRSLVLSYLGLVGWLVVLHCRNCRRGVPVLSCSISHFIYTIHSVLYPRIITHLISSASSFIQKSTKTRAPTLPT